MPKYNLLFKKWFNAWLKKARLAQKRYLSDSEFRNIGRKGYDTYYFKADQAELNWQKFQMRVDQNQPV